MTTKYSLIFLMFLMIGFGAEAQIYPYYSPRPSVRVQVRPSRPPMRRQNPKPRLISFHPTVNVSIGYGFPNLDQNQFIEFSDAYRGDVNQAGVLTGSIDYQFSRYMSIGIMGTYGKISAPYYYNYAASAPDFTGSLENYSIMLNLMNYFPSNSSKVAPYLRTAIGLNNWNQEYIRSSGEKMEGYPNPTQFSYQAALGARLNLSKNAGLYLEGGYGKYILNGGLTFKF